MTRKLYVNMTDKFMSGWGKAEHGRALYCIECDTPEQAEQIERAANRRPEMKFVTIAQSPRRARRGDVVNIRHFNDLTGAWKE